MCNPSLQDQGEELIYTDRKIKIDFSGLFSDLKNLNYNEVIWRNVFRALVLHVLALYGNYLFLFNSNWKTAALAFALVIYSGLGVTMGSHRLWAHRSYKARFPLRLFLAIAQTIAFQFGIVHWSRMHRLHHKRSETDEDPHNSLRGFFFAHCGWLLMKTHPECAKKLEKVDVSDVYADPIARFQDKYYMPLVLLLCYAVPTFIPWYFWKEDLVTAFLICGVLKHTYTLNFTAFANSIAHWVGVRPYDKHIRPSEHRTVSYLTLGEGWHNYHHVFPYDYRTSEFAGKITRNFTANIIDFCQYIGQAYDLKTVSESVLLQRKLRTGETEEHNEAKENEEQMAGKEERKS